MEKNKQTKRSDRKPLMRCDVREAPKQTLRVAPGQVTWLLRHAEELELSSGARGRLQWFAYALDHGSNVSLTCRYFGIARSTYLRWAKRFDPRNPRTLEEGSRRPHRVRQPETDQKVVALIRASREMLPTLGKEHIRKKLLTEHGICLSSSTVGRVIARHGFFFGESPSHREKRLRAQMRLTEEQKVARALTEGTIAATPEILATGAAVGEMGRKESKSTTLDAEFTPSLSRGGPGESEGGGSDIGTLPLSLFLIATSLVAGLAISVPKVRAAESASFKLYDEFSNYAERGPGESSSFKLNEDGITWESKPLESSSFRIVTAPPVSAAGVLPPPAPPPPPPPPPGGGSGPGSGPKASPRGAQEPQKHPAAREQAPHLPSALTPAPRVAVSLLRGKRREKVEKRLEARKKKQQNVTPQRDEGRKLSQPRSRSRRALLPLWHMLLSGPTSFSQEPRGFLPSWGSMAILFLALSFFAGTVMLSMTRKRRGGKRRKHSRASLLSLLLACGLTVLLWLLLASSAFAAETAPLRHVYNGHLLDSSGNAITTSHSVRFSYWRSANYVSSDVTATGAINVGAGNYVGWNEVHTVTPNSQGYFTAEFGSGTALPTMDSLSAATLTSLYLQVEVKASAAADTGYELLDSNTSDITVDRSSIHPVPFALNADMLDQRDTGTGSGDIVTLGSGGTLSLTGDRITIDSDDSAASEISLQFGRNLAQTLTFDVGNDRFNFNDDVRIEGNLTVTGLINGVNLAALASERTVLATYHAEHQNAAYQGDGTSNVGRLFVSHDSSSQRNFYQWTSSRSTLQDYDVILRITLSPDFVRFAQTGTVNPLRITYRSTSASNADNQLGVSVFDTNGSPVSLSGSSLSSAQNLVSTSWATEEIEFTGSPTWTAGQDFKILLKLSARSSFQMHTGDLKLEYIALPSEQ